MRTMYNGRGLGWKGAGVGWRSSAGFEESLKVFEDISVMGHPFEGQLYHIEADGSGVTIGDTILSPPQM